MEVVRGSSRSELTEKQSRLVMLGTTDDAARRFTELFARRGVQLTDRQLRKGGATLYVFKGKRSELTSMEGGGNFVVGTTNTVGSAYYVLLTPQADGTTRAELFGKPTVDGQVVCGEQEPAWVPRCTEDVYAGGRWTGLDLTTGREEAETLRGMRVELDLGAAGKPGSPVAPMRADEPEKPSCIASELPEWKTSNAQEKKRLLDKCRTPAPVPDEGTRAVEVL